LIRRTAHTQRKLAVVPDLVAIDLPGGPAFVSALQHSWDCGDAVLPLDQRLSKSAQRAVLDRLRPARVIGLDGDERRSGGEPVEPGDALVMATSGTTGVAKGVILTHSAVLASARATSERLGVNPDEHRWLACLPLNHVGGLAVVTRALLTGAPLKVLPRFDREQVQAAGGPDVLVSLVPTALARVGAEHFRTVVLGGSAPPEELPPNVIPTYGLTETGSGVVYGGTPLPGVELAIAADTKEVLLRGPMLFRGYRDGTNAFNADGWLATGDAGQLDGHGWLHIFGRRSDLIISGGENVWPGPVEAALLTHPTVAEVAVAGTPDPEWGQRVVAWIVPTDRAALPSLDELRRLVAESVAPYAAPRQLVLVDHLPRTSIGKVQRALLPPPEATPGRRP
jgi:o-succinylbenzoate---CoA ligase